VEDEAEDEVEDEAEDDKEIKTIKQRVIKLFDKNPDIDIMFLDEAHFGMSTEKAQQIVKVLDSVVSNTIKIYVTTTYNKPLQAYGVKAECKLTWDMNDIQTMKTIDENTIQDNAIKKQFGYDNYIKALEYFGDKTGLSLIDKFKKDYAIFPKPYLITSVWDKEFLNVEKLKIGDTEFGWDMNKLFATIGDSDNFANKEQIKEMMNLKKYDILDEDADFKYLIKMSMDSVSDENVEKLQKEFNFTISNIKNLPNSLSDSSQILLDISSIQIKNSDIKIIDDFIFCKSLSIVNLLP
jgi:hypothetical protein